MMLRRTRILLLVLLLAACGGQQARDSTNYTARSIAAPAAASSAAASPEVTVNQAIEVMANSDEAGLSDMYDSSVAMYAAPFAQTAIQHWGNLQNNVEPLSTIALGPIQSREMHAPETSGQTTRIVVPVTYEIGKADLACSLRQRDQAWKLFESNGKTTERKHP